MIQGASADAFVPVSPLAILHGAGHVAVDVVGVVVGGGFCGGGF